MPQDHLLRSIDRFVDLSGIRAHLAEFYSLSSPKTLTTDKSTTFKNPFPMISRRTRKTGWLRLWQGYTAGIAKSCERINASEDKTNDLQNETLRAIEADLLASFDAGRDLTMVDLTAHQGRVADIWGNARTADAYAKLAELYLAHPYFWRRDEAALTAGFWDNVQTH